MSLYNELFGVNPAALFVLPLLGEKHPDEYPRFRDCYVTEDNNIAVYTRVGGGNRGCGYGEEELYKHPNFLYTEDDDFDETYATYYFSVPEEWKEDFDKLLKGDFAGTSPAYKERVHKVFPKLKDMLDELFKAQDANKPTTSD